jgi:tetratricopeptide (TPR) repeat protein
MAVIFGLLTVWFQTYQVLHGRPAQSEGFLSRIALAGRALWFYLGKALLPINLTMIYPNWQTPAAAAGSYLPLVSLVAVFAVCWRSRRRWGKHVLFALAFFVINLFPVLGLFDMYFLQISRVSDHFQYLPLIGVVSGVAALLTVTAARLGRTRHATDGAKAPGERQEATVPALGWALAFLLVGGLSFATVQRSRLFATDEGLWQDTLVRNPAAWPAHNNLACLLAERHDLPQAIEHFEASLRLHPGNAAAQANLGQALAQTGRFAEAEPHFRTGLELKPNSAEAHRFYASALVAQGRVNEALPQFEAALQLQPNVDTRQDYAMALNRTGNAAAAVEQFRLVLSAKPDLVEALNNLAWILATCSDQKVRDGNKAVRLAEQSCRLTDYRQAIPVGTLAAAYAEAGRFPEAETTAKKAIALAEASGNARFAAINEQLLQLYHSGRAYHERR